MVTFKWDDKRANEIAREEGLAEGLEKGLKKGKINGRIDSIRSLMKQLKISAEKAMELLEIPESERQQIVTLL